MTITDLSSDHLILYSNLLVNFVWKWVNAVLISVLSVILAHTGEHCVHWNLIVPTLRVLRCAPGNIVCTGR